MLLLTGGVISGHVRVQGRAADQPVGPYKVPEFNVGWSRVQACSYTTDNEEATGRGLNSWDAGPRAGGGMLSSHGQWASTLYPDEV